MVGHKTEFVIKSTMKLVVSACNESMLRRRPRHNNWPIYWWTNEFSEIYRAFFRARRAAVKACVETDSLLKSEESTRRALRWDIIKRNAIF